MLVASIAFALTACSDRKKAAKTPDVLAFMSARYDPSSLALAAHNFMETNKSVGIVVGEIFPQFVVDLGHKLQAQPVFLQFEDNRRIMWIRLRWILQRKPQHLDFHIAAPGLVVTNKLGDYYWSDNIYISASE
jgi:hypothetical protein